MGGVALTEREARGSEAGEAQLQPPSNVRISNKNVFMVHVVPVRVVSQKTGRIDEGGPAVSIHKFSQKDVYSSISAVPRLRGAKR